MYDIRTVHAGKLKGSNFTRFLVHLVCNALRQERTILLWVQTIWINKRTLEKV